MMPIDPLSKTASSEQDTNISINNEDTQDYQTWLNDNGFEQFDVQNFYDQMQGIFSQDAAHSAEFWQQHGLSFQKDGNVRLVNYEGDCNEKLIAIKEKLEKAEGIGGAQEALKQRSFDEKSGAIYLTDQEKNTLVKQLNKVIRAHH